jgi:predicted nucleotidyltransferase
MKKRVQEKQRTSKAWSFENLPLRIKCLSILVLGSFLNPKMYSRSSHIQCIIYGTCHHNRVFSEICEVEKSGG